MAYDLKYIRPHHREIARRLVMCQSLAEIGGALGISPTRVSGITKSPLFKLELKKLEEIRDKGVTDVRDSFAEASPGAVDIIERLMYNGSTESLRLKAAETILDRAGHGSISRGKVEIDQKVHISHSELTERELRELVLKRVGKIEHERTAQRALELEMEAVEVDFEEVEVEVEVEEKVSKKVAVGMLG